MSQAKARQTLQTKYIGKKGRVTTKNNRIFEGKIMCVDYKGNVILHQAVEQIANGHGCPINYQLYNYTDAKLEYEPPQDVEEEEKMRLIREYFGRHFYFGAVMVNAKDIGRFQLSNLEEKEQGQAHGEAEKKD